MVADGAALDTGMLYFDARLSEHVHTVEIRVADVCLDARHAAVIATLARALVETAARQWLADVPPAPTSTARLRAWAWHAARHGIDGTLVSPATGEQLPAGEVVRQLVEFVAPVLAEQEELGEVTDVVAELLTGGTGSTAQRRAYESRSDLRDVVAAALDRTHARQPPGKTGHVDIPLIA